MIENKLIFDYRNDTRDPRLFVEVDGKKYTVHLPGPHGGIAISTSYHPFGVKRYVTKWITSDKTTNKIMEFVNKILAEEA